MPVEIFELVVRANVGNSNNKDSKQNKKKSRKEKSVSSKEIDERILALMNRKKER